MNCYETIARLHLYLGRELEAQEVEIVQQHLIACPHCECRFHFDVRVRRLIHERCIIEQAPTHLREAVLGLAHSPVGEPVNVDPEVEMKIKADIEGWE